MKQVCCFSSLRTRSLVIVVGGGGGGGGGRGGGGEAVTALKIKMLHTKHELFLGTPNEKKAIVTFKTK